MAVFSKRSLGQLKTCDIRLQMIAKEALKVMDFTVLSGHRGKAEQDAAFAAGNSKLTYPKSKHNQMPSLAMDLAPYPVDWSNDERFYLLAGVILGIASTMGVELVWGGSWSDLKDLGHFEIKNLDVL